MKQTGSGRRHRALMKKIKAGIWGVIGVTAGICIIVNVAGMGKGSDTAVADTVQSEEQTAAETETAVRETITAEKKKVDMKEMTEGRVVIKENILKDSPNYGYTGELDVKGLMLHSIGVAITSAQQQADVFGAPDFWDAGIHGFIDSETGVVLHTLPWTQVAWHCGYENGNGSYIGVEMCESDAGYYTDTFKFVVEDEEKAKEHCRTAYYSAVSIERSVRDIFDDGEDEFIRLKDDAWHGINTTYWKDYSDGYARLNAVLEKITSTTLDSSVLSQMRNLIGNLEKKGICHILVNDGVIESWVNIDE